jgi:hypothetical protein
MAASRVNLHQGGSGGSATQSKFPAPRPTTVKEIDSETLRSSARKYSKDGNAAGLKSLADELKAGNICIVYTNGFDSVSGRFEILHEFVNISAAHPASKKTELKNNVLVEIPSLRERASSLAFAFARKEMGFASFGKGLAVDYTARAFSLLTKRKNLPNSLQSYFVGQISLAAAHDGTLLRENGIAVYEKLTFDVARANFGNLLKNHGIELPKKEN